MRQRDEVTELSAEARRELEALDRALAGQPVDAELDAVATLARELRSARPKPPDDFTARLDERAANGFPVDESGPSSFWARTRNWFEGMRPMRVLAPAGGVATVLIVASVAVLQSTGDDVASTPTTTAVEDGARNQAAQPAEGEAAGGAAGTAAPAPGTALPGEEGDAIAPIPPPDDGSNLGRIAPGENRSVENEADLGLSTDEDEFEDVSDGVVSVTDQQDGVVVSSEESSDDVASRAEFELEIPSENLQTALADLSELAHVASRTENSLDITAPTVSARKELADARALVRKCLTMVADAETPAETEKAREQLAAARSDAAAAKAEVQQLARRARFATVGVTVVADGNGDGSWGVSDAVDDVLGGLSTAGGVAIVSAAILLPLALIVALIALVWRASVRRGRERSLDPPPPGA